MLENQVFDELHTLHTTWECILLVVDVYVTIWHKNMAVNGDTKFDEKRA